MSVDMNVQAAPRAAHAKSTPPQLVPLPTPTSAPTLPASSASSDTPAQAKRAAQAVYHTPELLHQILVLLDKCVLAAMLTLHKACSAPVAAVLFRTVNQKQVKGMNRADSRRAAYCDAVQIVNRSPPPKFKDPFRKKTRAKVFNHKALRTSFTSLRKTFPNLHTISDEHPGNEWDDSFIARLTADGTISVDLVTHFEIDLYAGPFPTPGPTLPPPSAAPPKLEIRETIALDIVVGEESDWDGVTPSFNRRQEENGKWERWLYHNPHLDRRVSSINADRASELFGYDEEDFIGHRLGKDCHPLRRVEICPASLEEFAQVAASVGPNLRHLHMSPSIVKSFRDLQGLVPLIDKYFPLLEELHIQPSSSIQFGGPPPPPPAGPPPRGLANLRKLSFPTDYSKNTVVARHLWRLGSDQCIFATVFDGPPEADDTLTRQIQDLKS